MCLPSSGQVCSLDGDLVFVSQIPRTVHSGELNLLQFRTSYIDLNDIVCFLALDVVYRMGLSLKERTENDNCRQNPPDGRLCYRILQVEIIISAVAQH